MAMLKEFLKHFGNPLIVALPDVKKLDEESSKVKWNIRMKTDVLMELNRQLPFGLYFTPNGNYGDVVNVGEELKNKRVKTDHGSGPYYHCLYCDIDRANKIAPTGYADNKELRVSVKNSIDRYQIPPSFVIESFGGFHLYWLFNPAEKEKIQNLVGEGVMDISRYICGLFEGGDSSGIEVNKLMRLPETNHWKTGNPEHVKVFQYVDGELLETYDESKLRFFSLSHINSAVDYIKSDREVDVTEKKIIKNVKQEEYIKVSEIKFKDIFAKLEKYPKIFKSKTYTFFIGGNDCIGIRYADGSIKETNGYVLNKRDNYVNCFSSHYHPVEERPRGGPFPFLFNYFDRDYRKLEGFLNKEFGFSILNKVSEDIEGETVVSTIEKDDYTLIFTNKRVQMKKVYEKKDGSQSISTRTLFNLPVMITGKAKLSTNDNYTENDHESLAILATVNSSNIIIKRHPSKSKFNGASKELFFYGDDNELGYFYEAVEYSDKVPLIDCVNSSGFYEDFVYLGGTYIYGKSDKFELPIFTFSTEHKPQISIAEYIENMSSLYDDYIAVPACLQAIALGGMNLRDNQTIYPALLLTGFTTSGKSTLGRLLKSMLGYSRDARQYALPSLSPQPLKQYASDYAILFLEEITSDVQEKCEDLLRNIINRDKGARGTSGGNIFYNMKSPLLVMGERTFKDESINNRFLSVVMDQINQKGDRELLENMSKYSCSDEIYEKYLANKHKLKDCYNKRTKKLLDYGFNNRYSDVRAYIFVINELFELNIDNEKLVEYSKKNLRNMGVKDKMVQVSIDHQLKSILVDAIMKKQLIGSISEHGTKVKYEITLMSDFYQKNKAILNLICNRFNELGSDMCIEGGNLTVSIETVKAEPADFVLDIVFKFVKKIGRYAFTNVNSYE